MEIRDSEMSLVFFILYICKMKKIMKEKNQVVPQINSPPPPKNITPNQPPQTLVMVLQLSSAIIKIAPIAKITQHITNSKFFHKL